VLVLAVNNAPNVKKYRPNGEITPNLVTLFITSIPDRVTRLGEFSPNGRMFSLDRFYKITEVAHTFMIPFPKVLIMYQF
jgi:hypothetical protein